jgi:CRP-like cAMP-binding protein
MNEQQLEKSIFEKLLSHTKVDKSKHTNFIFMRKLKEFNELNEIEILELLKFFHVRIFQENEKVFNICEEGSAFYILSDGKVKVSQGSNVLEFEAPFLFGEEGLFNEEAQRFINVQCLKKSKFIVCYKPDLDLMLLKKPLIAAKLLKILGKNISDKIIHIALKNS